MSIVAKFDDSSARLTYDEKATLGACENIIDNGLKTFVEVGEAFAVIRDKRLYRETHSRFDKYCEERWELSERHTNRLIQAASIVDNLRPMGLTPSSERVARPLAPLSAKQQQTAWGHAVANSSNGTPTATQVKQSVEYIRNDEGAGIKSAAPLHTILTSSNSDEYYTPKEVVEAVLECFDGVIELDPGSNSRKSPNVPARKVYTIEDDGLSHVWKAKTLYTNPPYSDVKTWMQKLVAEYSNGNVGEAIALVKADTSTQWFALGFEHASAICFVNRRLTFHTPGDVQSQSAPFASALIYFGENVERFYSAFEATIGVCVQRIHPDMLRE